MSIDPNTLPDGTAVEIERCVFAIREDGQISSGFVGGGPFTPSRPIARVFVPVPDGMTLADAEAALADAGAWVEVETVDGLPHGARMRNNWRQGDPADDRTYVHRDDLPPTDPDAELVAAIEKSVPIGSWDGREVLRRLRAEGFDVTHEATR